MAVECSFSELQTVCSIHVADYLFEIVFIHNVRDSGVGSVAVLDYQLVNCQNIGQQPKNGGQCHPPVVKT